MTYCFLRFPGGRLKAVTLSYDDGHRSDIRLSETITRYGLKCTFNLCSGLIGKGEPFLTAEEIREHILDKGHEIAVHGEYHRACGLVRPADCVRDVLNCRLALESRFGGIIRGMAYPDSGIRHFENGASYEEVRRILQGLGIAYARSLGGDNDRFDLPTDWYNWVPTAHHANPKVLDFIEKFHSIRDFDYPARNTPRLFYLWGHSFEFENTGWELLETICARLSGHEDVWYAANTEIYDYVAAYNSLIFSADGLTVYNPTLVRLWMYADGAILTIDPGETKRIG